jgi:hypothetical protein
LQLTCIANFSYRLEIRFDSKERWDGIGSHSTQRTAEYWSERGSIYNPPAFCAVQLPDGFGHHQDDQKEMNKMNRIANEMLKQAKENRINRVREESRSISLSISG